MRLKVKTFLCLSNVSWWRRQGSAATGSAHLTSFQQTTPGIFSEDVDDDDNDDDDVNDDNDYNDYNVVVVTVDVDDAF